MRHRLRIEAKLEVIETMVADIKALMAVPPGDPPPNPPGSGNSVIADDSGDECGDKKE